jgi:hypothetical protein
MAQETAMALSLLQHSDSPLGQLFGTYLILHPADAVLEYRCLACGLFCSVWGWRRRQGGAGCGTAAA